MKTAKELLQEHVDAHCFLKSKCFEAGEDAMIEFAKMHVEAAIETIIETDKTSWILKIEERQKLIRNSYPLTNIK